MPPPPRTSYIYIYFNMLHIYIYKKKYLHAHLPFRAPPNENQNARESGRDTRCITLDAKHMARSGTRFRYYIVCYIVYSICGWRTSNLIESFFRTLAPRMMPILCLYGRRRQRTRGWSKSSPRGEYWVVMVRYGCNVSC